MSDDSWKEIILGDNSGDWTKESDHIFIEPNGRSVHEMELILNELIGPVETEWRFLGSPRVNVHPDISIKKIRKEEIIGILKSNNLLLLP